MSRKLTYDHYLFAATVLIVVIGLVMIYSASAMIAPHKTGSDNPYHFLARQGMFLLLGGGIAALVMRLDTSRLRDPRLIYALLAVVIAMLVVVLFQPAVNRTHRWFLLGGFNLQPSELAKPVIVLFLAAWLAQREERINALSQTLVPLLSVLALTAGLILLQPDYGTAVTIVAVAAVLVYVAGVSWGRILLFGVPAVAGGIVILLAADYRRDRLIAFLNPEADPLGKGFQAMQSLIAIGTGGLHGLGFGNGRQKLFFLPEPHTDFIFAIVGEETGFIGALALIALFGIVVWRGFRLAYLARDRFTFYAALGLTLMIGLQALINISVTLSLLPTKGIPLPLVSYGGSSLIASLIAVGILLNLSQQTN
jgi:cell division protein FtsW